MARLNRRSRPPANRPDPMPRSPDPRRSSAHVDTRSWAARSDHRRARRARRLSRSGREADCPTGASAPSTRNSASTGRAMRRSPTTAMRGIRALLEGLQDRFGWDAVLEQRNIIALRRQRLRERRRHQSRARRPARTFRRAACECARDLRGNAPASLGGEGDRRRARHRFFGHRLLAEMDACRDAGHAQGPLRDHAALYADQGRGLVAT